MRQWQLMPQHGVEASSIAELFTLGVMSPCYNNCCRKFPWRYQQTSGGLVIGFGAISQAGAIKWVQEPFLAMRHYDPSRHIEPNVNNPVNFFITHFQYQLHRDIVPRVNALLVRMTQKTHLFLFICILPHGNLNTALQSGWTLVGERTFYRISVSHQKLAKFTTTVNRSRPKLNYGAGRDFGVEPEFGATRKQPIIPGNSRVRSHAGVEDRVTWLDLRPG